MSIINQSCKVGRQSLGFSCIIDSENGFKLKIEIKSDAYQEQSYARSFVFNREKLSWNLLADIHPSNMQTEKGVLYKRDFSGKQNVPPQEVIDFFKDDLVALVQESALILDDKFDINELVGKNKSSTKVIFGVS